MQLDVYKRQERDVAGGCGEVAVIVTAAVALTGLAALIAGRLRQRLRLLFQQLVQGCLLYTSQNCGKNAQGDPRPGE